MCVCWLHESVCLSVRVSLLSVCMWGDGCAYVYVHTRGISLFIIYQLLKRSPVRSGISRVGVCVVRTKHHLHEHSHHLICSLSSSSKIQKNVITII